MKKVWFITGAGRRMGVGFAKAALAAGNAFVATGRNTDAVNKAVGQADDLLVAKPDITSLANAKQKVADLQQQIDAYPDLSTSLVWEEA
jgi:NAD(P)-dependent dehydrogenase (short-subunit alcohol dehydrogenase family)